MTAPRKASTPRKKPARPVEVHYAGMQAVREMPSDWYCPRSEPGRMRRDCPECVAEVALDAALAVVYSDGAT